MNAGTPEKSGSAAPTTIESGGATNVGSSPNHDHNDMLRLGKKQVFDRTFGFWPTFGFTNIYIATWEYLLVGVYAGLVNGGFGGLVYEYIGTTLCYTSVVLSLAEMSSMAPTSGGQYHWTSEFAPPGLQRYLSYAAGWLSATGWLFGAASGYFIMSTLTQAIVAVYLPDLSLSNWQNTLIAIGWLCLFVLVNLFGARLLPLIENIALVGHFAGWIITVVALWVMAPKKSSHEVFTEVINSGGWSNNGLSCLVGTVAVLYCQLGPEAAVHIAEEVQNAAWVLPRCIAWGYVLNGVLGFIMLITLVFTMGTLEEALDADSPFETAFANTGSQGMNMALIVILGFLIAAGNVTAVTTSSRETWAFARDGGLPFSRFMAKVSIRWNAPLNAIWVTTALSIILCLINLASSVAFNIIISLNLVAFLSTYMLSIGSVLYRRLYGDPLPPSRFSLGLFAVPINIFAVGYSALAMILSCFPIAVPVDASNANWAPAIFGAVIFVAVIWFSIRGRKNYEGPVVFVEGRRREGMGLQTSG